MAECSRFWSGARVHRASTFNFRKLLRVTASVCVFNAGTAIAHGAIEAEEPTIVVQWNNALLQGVRDSKLGPPMVARALAIVHTCMYDAWAAYDPRALPTQSQGFVRQPVSARTMANKQEAISYAAYRGAVDLFPADDATVFRPLMNSLGYDPDRVSTDPTTPAGVGNLACSAVLDFRHHDGSNQLGDLSGNGVPYADYTGYQPANPPSTVPVPPQTIVDPNQWQPVQYADATGHMITQTFLGAQWGRVIPFALRSGDQFRGFLAGYGPALYGSPEYVEQAEELIHLSADLTDRQKMIAEYWKDGPHSETPPGHWCLLAQFVSVRDHQTLDEDVKLFFALTNAELDASIVAWDAKRAFNSIRPISAVPYLFQGQTIRAWGGPGKGTVTMRGEGWIPYQPSTFPTPPFPEYISGHSTFSAAGAAVLRLFTRSEKFGASVSFKPGSSVLEPGVTPKRTVTLHWPTFTDAADQAGFSRRLGGIHFRLADELGRAVGKRTGEEALRVARRYWTGDEQ